MASELTQTQHAQMAAILGQDQSHFETLISHLMSTNNNQRSQAESLYNLCKQHQPDSLSLKLAHLLQSSPHPEARAMAALLLRKLLTRDDSFLWPQLTAATQSTIKSILLACVPREEAKTVSKKLCDTISELAAGILPENGWAELLPFMFQWVKSDNPKLLESALLIFGQLAQFMCETLVPDDLDTLHNKFFQCLGGNSSSEVRVAALGATINFIPCLSSTSDPDRFQDLLTPMMQILTVASNCEKEATAQEAALVLLIDLAKTEPRFLRGQLVDVVGKMVQIAEAESLKEWTRHSAINFLITLAESAPGMMRNLPPFIQRLFGILMKMLLDIEDDPVWHSADIEDEDPGESSTYGFAQYCLHELLISLGGNTIVPVALELLPAFLAAPEWQKQHAALICLAQIAECCSTVTKENLEHVVSMVLDSFQESHARVRWAAINAIGQLSTDLGPDLQMQYHNPRFQVISHHPSCIVMCFPSCSSRTKLDCPVATSL